MWKCYLSLISSSLQRVVHAKLERCQVWNQGGLHSHWGLTHSHGQRWTPPPRPSKQECVHVTFLLQTAEGRSSKWRGNGGALLGEKETTSLTLSLSPNPSTRLIPAPVSFHLSPSPEFQMGTNVFPALLFPRSCILTIASRRNWHRQGAGTDLHSSAEGTPVNPFLQRCGSLNNKSRGQTRLSLLLKRPFASSSPHGAGNTRGLLWGEGSGQTGDVLPQRTLPPNVWNLLSSLHIPSQIIATV